MKKVSIKHIEEKTGIDAIDLKKIFVDHWLITSADKKKVDKKAAKHLIREMQWITKHWFSRMWFLESFGTPKIAYFLLWLLALGGLFGSLFRVYQQWGTTHWSADYTVQSLAPGDYNNAAIDIDALVEHGSVPLPETGASL